uniref:UL75A n=1 Tax=Panine betaherpesvirus 2 TaxID=188763 RepID=A0A8F7PPY5_9BETA|nr:UL75A [Panine betaherpesvirus 2]
MVRPRRRGSPGALKPSKWTPTLSTSSSTPTGDPSASSARTTPSAPTAPCGTAPWSKRTPSPSTSSEASTSTMYSRCLAVCFRVFWRSSF